MEQLQKIDCITERFLEAILINDFSQCKDIFTENVTGNLSIAGQTKGIEELIKKITYKGPQADHAKQNVENKMSHVYGNSAKESFHLFMLYVKKNGRFHYGQYGGSYNLQFIKANDEWKICKVLFDLTWTEGNNYWFKDWKQVDYSVPIRYKKAIDPKTDSVYNFINVSEETNDVKDMEELVFIYSLFIDTEDTNTFRAKATLDFYVWDDYHKQCTYGVENIIDKIHSLNLNEPTLHHTFRIWDIDIQGEEAVAYFSRVEPNRTVSKSINRNNWTNDFFTLDYKMHTVKTNGVWLIKNIETVTVLNEKEGCGRLI